MQALRTLLEPDRLTSVVDVGCNPIDGDPVYTRMMDEGLCTVVGFDPLTTTPTDGPLPKIHINEKRFPYVIGDGREHKFHICKAAGMSGLLEPDISRLLCFPGMKEAGHVNDTRMIQTVRLDDVAELGPVDFLKMDVQGAELDVIRSGQTKLAHCVAILAEVSFMPLYRGQPSFADVDQAMRSRGFVPHCFAGAKLWPVSTDFPVPNLTPQQILDADVMYVRDFTKPMTSEEWKHLALIAHHVCGSFDLAMHCVAQVAKAGAAPPSATAQYRQMLEQA